MRRTLLLAAGFLGVLLAVVAPALSVRPYQPRAVDFEMAAPAALGAARAGAVESPVLRAPKRFNLVGLRWEGDSHPRISLRVRRAGGRWSEWVRVGGGADHAPDPGTGERGRGGGGSDPIWAGEADELQYRLSRRVSGLRLHFVNAAGTATPAERAKTALRRAAQSGFRTVATLLGAADAGAQDAQPEIAPRAAWENGQCQPRSAPAYREVKLAFVHHTVSANEYTAEQVPAMLLSICRYHRNSNGWNDIGYNFLVDKFGRLWEGRAGGVDKPVVGAHTEGMNTQSFAVSNIGDHSTLPAGEPAMEAMTRLIRWKLPLHGQPTSGTVTVVSNGGGGSHFAAGEEATLERVSGHRDANSTACPGQALYDQLPALRERVAGAPVAPRPPAQVTLERPPKRVAKNTNVKMRGSVAPAKQSLSILVEKKVGKRWQRFYGRTVPARSNGSFLKKVRFRHEGLYRATALFGGDGSNAPARSRTYHVRVPHRGGTTSGEPPPPYQEPAGGGSPAAARR
ncbi:MAG TPA: N-acetylmuramoyl-L-alanine amidase [Thermoleophilaceae bacterium]|jgi:hypothetical protein